MPGLVTPSGGPERWGPGGRARARAGPGGRPRPVAALNMDRWLALVAQPPPPPPSRSTPLPGLAPEGRSSPAGSGDPPAPAPSPGPRLPPPRSAHPPGRQSCDYLGGGGSSPAPRADNFPRFGPAAPRARASRAPAGSRLPAPAARRGSEGDVCCTRRVKPAPVPDPPPQRSPGVPARAVGPLYPGGWAPAQDTCVPAWVSFGGLSVAGHLPETETSPNTLAGEAGGLGGGDFRGHRDRGPHFTASRETDHSHPSLARRKRG
ncbi:basic proline-rich protein-like [Cervus elaphus]|uniref:basic proline-rich protein-like n=1 Tax=Cervus elaphus TaxID=9860 RepID=UPI001CC28FFC|nr:basic proline-rich protein-like [Cervus elaphus]